MTITFEEFPKISRLSREVIVTEKIDGTNAQIIITEDGRIGAASRSRIITPDDDNFGFAAWVEENRDELLQLGHGRHFGEWYGQGIQRKYGLDEKRFALFNVSRWGQERPACCHVVPTLWQGNYDDMCLNVILHDLANKGSMAVPGFMKPEGVVIYHIASRTLFKKTIEKDQEYKGKQTYQTMEQVP
jgi:hypothetical protein